MTKKTTEDLVETAVYAALDRTCKPGDMWDEFMYDPDGSDNDVKLESVETFSEAGVLTKNKGVILKLSDGTEFQLTIVQTK